MRDTTIEIVKATIPVLVKTGQTITTRFYELLLEENPEIVPMFNRSHQGRGLQAHALAQALLAFAKHIDTPHVLGKALDRIAHKHASMGVLPQHYEIVGQCLLRTMSEVLGDAAAVEIIDAWGEAYEYLASVLIEKEEQIRQRHTQQPGGWRGPRRFKVGRITQESATVQSYYLVPVDGGPLLQFSPGQYLTVILEIDGQSVRRNYSISSAPGLDYYRITIEHTPGGLVSGYFHRQVQVGDQLDVLPPCGDFTLTDSDKPLVLISAGVGITPTISMLDAAIASDRPIIFLHATQGNPEPAFREHVQALAEAHPQLHHTFVGEDPDRDDAPQYIGLIDRSLVLTQLADLRSDLDVYFVGPQEFMQTVFGQLEHLGIAQSQVHFEFFGPQQELTSAVPDQDSPTAQPQLLMPDMPVTALEVASSSSDDVPVHVAP
ncbi:MAG: NO-inducible flavohemoprotein [Myxococcota bacterium]